MATTIVTQTIGGIPDQRAALANSYFARPHGVTTWNTLRIALRVHMENTGANLISTPRFFVGLCSGTSAPYGSGSPVNVIGTRSNIATWTYTAASGGNMTSYSASNLFTAVKVVGGVVTSSGILTNVFQIGADNTAATRRLFFVEITKGSPNYTVQAKLFCNVITAAPDVLVADYLAQAELSTPAFTNHTVNSGTALAFSESAGVLDCVNIAWDRTTPKFHICDLAVVRIA